MSEEEQTYYEERHKMEHNLQKMEEMLQAYIEQARTAAGLEEKYPRDPERIKESKTAAVMVHHAQALVNSAKADLEKLKSTRVSSPEPNAPTVQATGSYAALEPPTPKEGRTMKGRLFSLMITFFAIIGLITVMALSWGPITNWWEETAEPVVTEFADNTTESIRDFIGWPECELDDSDNPLNGTGSGNTEPEEDGTVEPEYSPPPGSEIPWDCSAEHEVLNNGEHRHPVCHPDP